MGQLRVKYADRDVEFIALYVREPHPGERGFREFVQPTDFGQKLEYARRLVKEKPVGIPVIVDELEGTNHERLGSLPNFVYIVNKEGRVEYAATWLKADSVDAVLAGLVTADDPTRPVHQTISTDALGPAI